MNMESIANVEKSVGEAIFTVRKMRKLTQKAFAQQLTDRGMAVDASAVSRMEKGERALRIAECLVVAEVLEVDLPFLLRGIQTPAQELKETRTFADFCRREMSASFADWLGSLLIVKWELESRPELIGEVPGELTSHSDYLPWVASRLADLEWEYEGDSDDSYILTRNQDEVDALIECLVAYARGRIIPDRELANGEHKKAP
ncbi:helix-turn-helix domain-containing protein [Arthrobacter psychrochitiniphilus]|uniref:helix-turn-helix domain-containing protein n=1 Tax=Arthrobacter psychrochitiniphilus TaxID=291045 RepID=UPI003F7BAEF5